MKTLVGIFPSHADAEAALQDLEANGFSQDQFALLTPGTSAPNLTTETAKPEPPGACGANTGQVAGAITGFAGGVLGGVMVSLALPGIGPIIAIGALALGGSLGAVAGGVVGNSVQETYAPTLPPEDLFIYEEALRQGASLLIIQPSGELRAEMAHDILHKYRATATEDAWKQWWQPLFENEAAVYGTASSIPFAQIEEEYRRGFQSRFRWTAAGETSRRARSARRYILRGGGTSATLSRRFRAGKSLLSGSLRTRRSKTLRDVCGWVRLNRTIGH